MPDHNIALDFLATAQLLALKEDGGPSPTQANMRRAISTAYYAVFHCLAKSCADALVGMEAAEDTPSSAWVEVYRGLSHGVCKQSCIRARSIEFPTEIHTFADSFNQLQAARHSADYDPKYRADLQSVSAYISSANKCITELNTVREKDRKAFAAWVLISSSGAEAARKKQPPPKKK